ncbi:hypothetical protein ACKTEK_05415 [Tepidamorphus sp. 3E244]|uniref:hypothetical protein n=1 Tax=Tepidamorphus sp. 3E244 TaxID=3385498 RepID=UPI0038FD2652
MNSNLKRLAVTSFAALTAGSAFAADMPGPYDPPQPVVYEPVPGKQMFYELDVYGGWTWRGGDALGIAEDDSYGLIGGGGKVGWFAPNDYYVQFDVDAESAFADASDDTYAGSIQGIAHVGRDFNGMTRAGVFGGIGRGYNDVSPDSATYWVAGPEIQYRTGNWILTGQAGYLDVFDETRDEVLGDAFFARAAAAHFFNGGRTKLQGEILGAWGEQDFDGASPDDLDVVAFGAELEHQLKTFESGNLMSGFVGYRAMIYDEDFGGGSDKIDDHTVMVGLRIRSGGATLQEALSNGTSFDSPAFGAITQGATAVD